MKTYIQVNLEIHEEMDKFLNAYNQPNLDQEHIIHLNRLIASNEIEGIINTRRSVSLTQQKMKCK
jgi:hypothetical protein